MPEYTTMRTAYADGVLRITLDRPELLNRIDEIAHVELIALFRSLREQPDLRCVLLAAAGRHFSAGGDLNEVRAMQGDATRRDRLIAQAGDLYRALIDVPVPIVVALHGDAHGLGANIALSCDVVVAARGAKLSDPHVAMGMVAGDGGCVAWPLSLGLNWAKRYLLTGDRLSAEDAYARGLVTDLVDTAAQCLPAAEAIAQRIAALPPLAVRGTKRALNEIMRRRVEEVFDLALGLEHETLGSRDVLEAVDAFEQRRSPAFVGR